MCVALIFVFYKEYTFKYYLGNLKMSNYIPAIGNPGTLG